MCFVGRRNEGKETAGKRCASVKERVVCGGHGRAGLMQQQL